MQNKADFLDLLNEAKIILYGEKAKPFEMRQLTWFSSPKRKKKHYKKPIEVKKKKGGFRTIHAPNKNLKTFKTNQDFKI